MGSLSLERVQFKFASIIGELCSEPDVLSQFAVWLDLRLAEYKLKGNISLDCSGEEPDPIWLKGLSKVRKRKRSSPIRDSLPMIEHNIGSPIENVAPDSAERLSPDIVVVKEERGPAYPIDLVHIDRNNDSSPGSIRKHQVLDSSPSYHGDQWSQHLSSTSTPSKHRRVSHPPETASHQSLMSVISGLQGETQESDNKGNNSVFPARSLDISLTNDSSDQFNDSALSNSQFLQESSRQLSMSREGATSNVSGGASHSEHTSGTAGAHQQHPIPSNSYQRTSANYIARRTSLNEVPRASIHNMTTAARILNKWLWSRTDVSEKVQVQAIEPVTLNHYLKEFFCTIRRSTGEDYKRRSFQNLRGNLDRYLRHAGYPESIMNSPIFRESQLAYKERCSSLCEDIVTAK